MVEPEPREPRANGRRSWDWRELLRLGTPLGVAVIIPFVASIDAKLEKNCDAVQSVATVQRIQLESRLAAEELTSPQRASIARALRDLEVDC